MYIIYNLMSISTVNLIHQLAFQSSIFIDLHRPGYNYIIYLDIYISIYIYCMYIHRFLYLYLTLLLYYIYMHTLIKLESLLIETVTIYTSMVFCICAQI